MKYINADELNVLSNVLEWLNVQHDETTLNFEVMVIDDTGNKLGMIAEEDDFYRFWPGVSE